MNIAVNYIFQIADIDVFADSVIQSENKINKTLSFVL